MYSLVGVYRRRYRQTRQICQLLFSGFCDVGGMRSAVAVPIYVHNFDFCKNRHCGKSRAAVEKSYKKTEISACRRRLLYLERLLGVPCRQ